jgi:excisionase family DNA binding protein
VTDRPNLAALVADPTRIAELSEEAITSLLVELNAQEARLGTVKVILAARLASTSGPAPILPPTEAQPMTQEEAAEHYRIPLRSMRRLTRTKRIPSTMVGRNRMIRPRDLDEYLARCRHQGVAVGTILD